MKPPAARRLLAGIAVLGAAMVSCRAAPPADELAQAKKRMIDVHLKGEGITDPRVLAAMEKVRREAFCIPEFRLQAYDDRPLPIGQGQTISQPFIVAYMTQALSLKPGEKVLEIGTGSGYQAAVLAEMGAKVFSIEILESLSKRAEKALLAEGYDVHLRVGDGYAGWPEEAPFDAIIATAAPPEVPRALLDQLAPGGRFVVPVGEVRDSQELRLYQKDEKGTIFVKTLLPVRFVPMVRGEEEPEKRRAAGQK
ncbi:MAG: protein-L-isoaspartate(D-aspartate) O-methyltransferase [Bdellovibrionota bacterium]